MVKAIIKDNPVNIELNQHRRSHSGATLTVLRPTRPQFWGYLQNQPKREPTPWGQSA
ncbi:hypothetical protein [Laspinema palackyanum]|uniref:hypothetical protein n=1 Tax=Laspinema palackyanum TaxID=3231601 RepID=UPI00345D5414|nr:hypothetical protein [Laspinema sp. D2c]